ncbi:hypothetical protein SLH46_10270 [Draconibacterium sp. IB214405]|uniref:hypothetical protein n=1 Tax=Draconibacterium sp. IB214405 TaxID=3097352 RepID=UPI002A156722|nr:hypothetical protein [Draconibacterium sp. IB214405]MDX8339569.1 hypothetical protein [Draconibacterium sp. IB214405]
MESLKYFELRPSAGGSFSYGWRKMFEKSFLPLLVAVILVGLLSGPAAGFKGDWHSDDFIGPALFLLPLALFGLAYGVLFMPIIKYGEKKLFLNAMRDEEADLKVMFEGFKKQYLNIVLANLIVIALTMIGFFMLIIPGIIVACRLAFVPYLVMDKELDAMKAIEKSWQMTRGHGWTIFGMAILSFFIAIAGLIVFFVGIIFSIMWIHAAFATLYASVAGEVEDENPIPILGVNEVEE